MNHALIVKSRAAAAPIAGYTIVSPSPQGKARQANAATDRLLGVADAMGATSAGQMVDVQEVGLADVRSGGTFADGDPLTADAQGCTVLATPLAGSAVNVLGFARSSAVAGDIVPMLLAPGILSPTG